MSTISLRGIEKSFGATRVLAGVDLDVAQGEFVALLGPSGCGKSTLIRIIAGLESPDAGTLHIQDRPMITERGVVPPEARNLGMVFQSYAVWPHKTVLENVRYPLDVRGRPRKDADAAAQKILELVELGALGGRHPHELSGGQQQRVALARALVSSPEVLLLDEPLSNLDARLREDMRRELSDIRRRLGVTVVLVTHDQSEALATADRVAVMRAGKIVQHAAPEEIYRAPIDAYVAATVGALSVLPILEIVPGKDGPEAKLGEGVSIPIQAPSGAGPWDLWVRPESVRLDPAGPRATVETRAFLGDRVELSLRLAGHALRAWLPSEEAPRVGDSIGVRLLGARAGAREVHGE
ncbi:MAG: ABC transporter ATP-binding protein [Myxococcota bacterium]